jgi:hypothetical protein
MNTNTAAEYRDLPLAVLTESALKELVESIHINRQPSHRPKLPRRPLHNQPSKKSTRRSLDPHRLRIFVPVCPPSFDAPARGQGHHLWPTRRAALNHSRREHVASPVASVRIEARSFVAVSTFQ